MKKIMTGIMAVAIVALIVPAYAMTNSVSVSFNPVSTNTKISWDFGATDSVLDRSSCYAKTEVIYKTQSFFGKSKEKIHFFGEKFNTTYSGSFHVTASNIPDAALIDCQGDITITQKSLFKNYDKNNELELYMSFGEVVDGKINHLNEAATLMSSWEEIPPLDDCGFDTFSYTEEILVDPVQMQKVVYDKSSGTCITTVTDLSDKNQYKTWKKKLP